MIDLLMLLIAGHKDKAPLQEVKNILEPLTRATETTHRRTQSKSDSKSKRPLSGLETPINRSNLAVKFPPIDYQHSAMKGVVFTATGEALATPAPAELTNLFVNSPKVGLNFTKIFDFEEDDGLVGFDVGESDVDGPPPSPSLRKVEAGLAQQRESAVSVSISAAALPTRLRRPSSVRRSSTIQSRPGLSSAASDPSGLSAPTAQLSKTTAPSKATKRASSSATRPAAAPLVPKRSVTVPLPSQPPEYDLEDEENLPSPFLKRIEREKPMPPGSATLKAGKGPSKRPSNGNLLRVVAAVNVANANANAAAAVNGPGIVTGNTVQSALSRPALTSARKASEEARKALLRP